MKIQRLVIGIACSLLSFGCASSDESAAKYAGKWVLVEVVGSNVALECPDAIELSASGSYEVLNDCYGPDPRRPVVESGSWSVAEPDRLELKQRSKTVNYTFLGKERRVTIKNVTQKELVLCIQREQGKACTVERYLRRE